MIREAVEAYHAKQEHVKQETLDEPGAQEVPPHHPTYRRVLPISSACPVFPSSEGHPGMPNPLTWKMPPPRKHGSPQDYETIDLEGPAATKAPPTARKSSGVAHLTRGQNPNPTGESHMIEALLQNQESNRKEILEYMLAQRQESQATRERFEQLMT
eukprot:9389204-Pyramimonas_sp.AAC.1